MKFRKFASLACASLFLLPSLFSLSSCSQTEEVVRLKVYNCEEYIDEGGEGSYVYDELGEENAPHIINDFEDWFEETYGKKISVEYSCFGMNEDMYNQLLLGDQYDLICPSDYMIMKLAAEDRLQPYPDSFFDRDNELNYYINNVSEYIESVFENNNVTNLVTGEVNPWSKYAAGYMWGTTGLIYNPEIVDEEALSEKNWSIMIDPDFANQCTTKDNVRDCYFVCLAILYQEELFRLKEMLEAGTLSEEAYNEQVTAYMNDTRPETIAKVQEILLAMRDNIYGFETDTGKNDMVTGKISMNFAWSGDAVYAIDVAEESEVYLNYYIPEEASNLWFDGWVIPKTSTHAEEAAAFVNFLSMPENAIRNMYYVGYTSVIAGEEVFEYMDYTYGVEEGDEEEAVPYDLSYFFGGEDYVIYTYEDQLSRQLLAQYPTQDTITRLAVMDYFDAETYDLINEMWTKVKGATLDGWAIAVIVVGVVAIAGLAVYLKLGSKIDLFHAKPKKGYVLVRQEPYRK